jgi:GTP-binding protein
VFIDKVTIKVCSGQGGNGASTFRQEKFVAFGGPDGGDGGRGGSIYIEACPDMTTLLDFQYKSYFKAEDGDRGARKNMFGRGGKDLIIKVPVGTVIKDPEQQITIGDLTTPGQQLLVAEGGRGGRGNARFKSNKMRVPSFSEPGEPAVERDLELELKMIADVGIIGFPNAGKSTLISKLSAAKPKIADYAFTTLVPNLGVVRKQDGNSFVMADIPGLIEGASEGQGLGYQFLRHIERTRLLIHMVDVWGFMGSNVDAQQSKSHENPLNNFIQVNYELDNYSHELSERKQIIVLNKIEGYPDEELINLIKSFEDYTGLKISSFQEINEDTLPESNWLGLFAISTLSQEGINAEYERDSDGLKKLKDFIEKSLDLIPRQIEEIIIDEDPFATDHDDTGFEIIKEDQSDRTVRWLVHCGKIERIMKLTKLDDLESLNYLFRNLKALGIINAVKLKGAKDGDSINLDGVDFELTEAVLGSS